MHGQCESIAAWSHVEDPLHSERKIAHCRRGKPSTHHGGAVQGGQEGGGCMFLGVLSWTLTLKPCTIGGGQGAGWV